LPGLTGRMGGTGRDVTVDPISARLHGRLPGAPAVHEVWVGDWSGRSPRALCGATGTLVVVAEGPVTCPRCQRMRDEMRSAGIWHDEADASRHR
jgi:hypothetical protein